MTDIRKVLDEVGKLAERTKDDRLRRFGRPPKPEGEVGQVYSIRIPVAQISLLEEVAAARGKPPRTMLREWALERLEVEARGAKATRTPKGKRGNASTPTVQKGTG